MTGLLVGGLFLLGALSLLLKGWMLQRRQRALMQRLVPVRARVIDQGNTPSVTSFELSDGTQRQDVTFEGRYEYRIGEQAYAGTATASIPVFRKDQMPPNEITVFHDPTQPSVSHVGRVPESDGRAYMTFGFVVLIVGLCIAVVPNLDYLLTNPESPFAKKSR